MAPQQQQTIEIRSKRAGGEQRKGERDSTAALCNSTIGTSTTIAQETATNSPETEATPGTITTTSGTTTATSTATVGSKRTGSRTHETTTGTTTTAAAGTGETT